MQAIASFKEGDWIDEIYLVTSKQVSTAKNGVVYLSLKLADKSGEIDGRLWDNAETVMNRFERDDFVRVKGVVFNYQGSLQLKMKGLERVDDALVDLSQYIQSSPRDPGDMVRELSAAADGLKNDHLRKLMRSFLDDRQFMDAFRRAPAARTLHHNYVGGLMEHVCELISLCRDLGRHFPAVDQDLLAAGAFLHDIGKVRELGVRKSIEYTTEGRLVGHISLGYEMLMDRIRVLEGFPAELAMLLKHIMLSHHGEYEYGSPKRPKIQEALIIHYLDDLSAKISNFQSTMRKENVQEGEWSNFSKMHDRYLYRQASYASGPSAAPDEVSQDAAPVAQAGKRARRDEGRGSGGEEADGKLPLDM